MKRFMTRAVTAVAVVLAVAACAGQSAPTATAPTATAPTAHPPARTLGPVAACRHLAAATHGGKPSPAALAWVAARTLPTANGRQMTKLARRLRAAERAGDHDHVTAWLIILHGWCGDTGVTIPGGSKPPLGA